MRHAANDIVPGKFTLQIEGEVIAAFDEDQEVDAAPEAEEARHCSQQILVYGPTGELA